MGARGSGGHARGGPTKKDAQLGLVDLTSDITPPADLAEAARPYWDYFAPLQVRTGLLTDSSRETLRSYCQLLVQRDRIEVALRDSPVLILSTSVDGAGNEHTVLKANPLLAQQRQVEASLHTLANDLCLAPAAAIRLPRLPEPEADPLADWASTGTHGRSRMKAVK